MNRQSFVRVLLSLLLLLSQQMAMSHALSHWTGLADAAPQAQQGADGLSLSSAFARDQSCQQCLAFANLATPVGTAERNFIATPAAAVFAVADNPAAPCARTVCAFQSRAPPLA